MEKIKKYSLVIILVILLVVAAIIGIVKVVKTRTSVETLETENLDAGTMTSQEENEPMVTDVGENPVEEENGQEVQEEPNEPEVEKVTNKTQGQKGPYYIKINLAQNVVTIYTKDEGGNFTKPVKAMVCSIGKATPTSGVYTIPGGTWDRYIWGQMVGGVWAQYYVRIKGSILFHSVPYTSKDKSTLEYWEYDKLGTKASAGCIRLTVQDAKWIYDNCVAGTQVEFYSDSNPGPLGKPSAQKISGDEAVRGWDPTDPDSKNPWRNYTRPAEPAPIQPETPKKPETPVEPEAPVEPEVPLKPEGPVKPEVPVEPENPVEPEEPQKPEPPDKPEKPTEPEVPEEPEKPTKPEAPKESEELEKPTDANENKPIS